MKRETVLCYSQQQYIDIFDSDQIVQIGDLGFFYFGKINCGAVVKP